MIGTSFFRANKEKCPKCGTFGVEDTSDAFDVDDVNVNMCPTCSARFNEYLIMQDGDDIEFQNH